MFFRKLTVDSIVADIVLKAELLETLTNTARDKATQLQQKAGALITEAMQTAREGDRALAIRRNLLNLLEVPE